MRSLVVRICADFVLIVLVLLVLLQIQTTKEIVKKQRMFDESTVSYSELVPEKQDYQPGDLVTFSYVRKVTLDKEPLLLLTIDSFENQDTGEVFQGTTASRIIRTTGERRLKATRLLPHETTPGKYVFEGWLNPQGATATKPVSYSSQPFNVIKKK